MQQPRMLADITLEPADLLLAQTELGVAEHPTIRAMMSRW
jgi:hypothetical protein